ncbi:MAG: diguanylate cyclase [Lachnospiraceae bacterium]
MVLLYLYRRQDDRTLSGRWFIRVLSAFILLFVVDLCLELIIGNEHSDLRYWRGWMIYLIAYNLATSVWCTYSETQLYGSIFPDRRFFSFLHTIIGVNITISLICLIFGRDFFTSSHYLRSATGYFVIETTLLIALLVATAVRLYVATSDIADANQRHVKYMFATVPFFLIGSIVLSLACQNATLADLPITVILIVCFLDSTSRQISTDKLTGINNRQYLMSFVAQEIQTQQEKKEKAPGLFLLMIDVDFFKEVNDRYGHQEGDQALIRVADVLKTSCACYAGRAFLARFGGDEFIIVCEAEDRDQVTEFREKILMTMRQFNVWTYEKDSKPFDPQDPLHNLQLSVGIGAYKPGMTAVELLKSADEDLYRIKAEHHSIRNKRHDLACDLSEAPL